MPWYHPDHVEIFFWEALALLVVSCVLVPLFRRLGLGTVLGYLTAGVCVGSGLSLNFDVPAEELLHFAEFGVVLFLFVIGLELKPSQLWTMRRKIFGLGLAQVAVCGAVMTLPPYLYGLGWSASIVIGAGLALSSTALVMQMLDEHGDRAEPYGRVAFYILLFQDLAIVPLLLLVRMLSPHGEEPSLTDALTSGAIAACAIALLVLVGRYLLEPIFRLLSRTRLPEIMTASALATVIAAALVMDMAGMSYAMGAFIAGVLLSESSFRHEVEANIEPFRGLFLGLFFIAVGISLDLRVVAANWLLILLAVPLFMTLKGLATHFVLRAGGLPPHCSRLAALSLCQHGEFGFVLFSTAAGAGVLPHDIASILVAVISFSMAAAPFADRLRPLIDGRTVPETIDEDFSDAGGNVLVIGFGRIGQVVTQSLLAAGASVTLLDNDPDRIREARRFGTRVHFGDGTRRDVLRAAGAEGADLIAICSDRPEQTVGMIEMIRREFPKPKLIARTYDRIHSIQVANLGLDAEVRETFESAVRLGAHALEALGLDEARIEETIADVRHRDRERLREQIRAAAGAAGRQEAIEKVRPEPLARLRRKAAEIRDGKKMPSA
ncbi:monovalent cation:proton antiporter-2 (CPA2) family protein [Breoghania sp. JC706]|uniref:monovalent cation:proton antiporter-2 (CPA2) family protein n=1 Tax=Breoghania sp. JC706 TaxID=3117732 RepID=UPI0030086FCB